MKKRLCALLVALVLILSMPVVVIGGPGGHPPWPPVDDPIPPRSVCIECLLDCECDVEPVVAFGPGGHPPWPPVDGPIQP